MLAYGGGFRKLRHYLAVIEWRSELLVTANWGGGNMASNRSSATLAALVLALSSASAASAQTEASAIAKMKVIQREWAGAIASHKSILSECAASTWSFFRLSTDSSVTMDIKKTNSIITPLRGVIMIHGSIDDISDGPNADGFFADYLSPPRTVCYKSLEEAAVNAQQSDWKPRNGSHIADSFVVYYDISSTEVQFAGGDAHFMGAFGAAFELPANQEKWQSILHQKLK